MEEINKFLKTREKDGLLRFLRPASLRKKGKIFISGKEYVDFSSNDYLGLSGHAFIKKAIKENIDKWGAGASASRLLSGDSELYHELEKKTAVFKQKKSALIFNTGYQANIGIISAICSRHSAVFSDRLSHASIMDGVTLSGARLFRFRHNDTVHLEELLKKERSKFKSALIITESIFSMDGDAAPLFRIAELKEKHKAYLMIDEAHATGIFGKNGSGLAEQHNLADKVDLIMGTFSKALGSFGAYVACSEIFRSFFINSSRAFIYSTALPPPVIAANMAALDIVEKEPFRREELIRSSEFLREKLKSMGFTVRGESQIVPVILGENKKAVKMSDMLRERGYFVLPIRPPTVPPGESRIRLSITYDHDRVTLERFLNDIKEINAL